MSQTYPQNDYRYYLKHSFKGTTWKKEDAKYLYKKDGRYYYPEDVGADEASQRYKDRKERYSTEYVSIGGGTHGGKGSKVGLTYDELNERNTLAYNKRRERKAKETVKERERKAKEDFMKEFERRNESNKILYERKKARKAKEDLQKKNEAIRKENTSKASINKYDAEKKLEKKRSNKVKYTVTSAKSYANYLGRRSKAKIKKLTNALSKILP